ncbi:aspartic proteinase Asp1-like [Tripterygium wilfordii]|uniref:aspartic proteinase Asp1-like n=1 Tax=Tripterygium wilfordii TaxID=458696 RepID=UPI0018F83259|nr:aspartic proteinase Asp1-like [Tripterygium wilfordii]
MTGGKRQNLAMVLIVLLCTTFQGSFSEATSSVVFSLIGNEYTKWDYFTNINIGTPPKRFGLHIDTGSFLTWVQCDGAYENDKPIGHLYKPSKDRIVQCQDILCAVIQGKEYNCANPTDRCKYFLEYGDNSTSHGYLVRDIFPLRLTNGSIVYPSLVFGCGYKQKGIFKGAGILGLSKGPLGLLSQMHSQDLIQQIIGHCLSSRGGGFLFLGDDLIPSSGVSWTPFTYNNEKDYLSGPADLLFDGSETEVTGLQIDFDSGSALSYLEQAAYEHTFDLINQALERTPMILERSEGELPICWRHNGKPITSLNEVEKYFKNLTLSFKNFPDATLELPPGAYLILVRGKVCFGILDGDLLGLENANIIGAILMQDKLVIYDITKHRIGWTSKNCNT